MRPSTILRLLSAAAICGVLTAPGSGSPLPAGHSAILLLKAGRPRFEATGTGSRVVPRIEGFGHASRPGEPDLPVRVFLVAIPEGCVPALRVHSSREESLGRVEIAPFPTHRIRERVDHPTGIALHVPDGGKATPDASKPGTVEVSSNSAGELQDYDDDFTPDAAVYGRDADLPAEALSLGSIGYLREQRFVEVRYSPVLYNPARGVARFVGEVSAEVIFNVPEGAPSVDTEPFRPEPLFEGVYQESLINYEQGKLFRVHPGKRRPETTTSTLEASPSTAQLSSVSLSADLAIAAAGAPRYKILVSRPGIYRLDFTYLQANAPEMVAANPQTLTLRAEGIEVPISIRDASGNSGEADGQFNNGDFLEFYGLPKREPVALTNYDFGAPFPKIYQANDYTDTQVYWLTAEAGSHPRISSVSGAPGVPGFTVAPDFADTAIWNEDNVYLPLEDNDPFFSIPSLLAGSTQATRDISLALPNMAPVATASTVTVRMRGGSDITTSNPDHRTRVWINGDTAGGFNDTWDGEVILTRPFSEAQTTLTDPTTIHFSLPGIAGVSVDKQYIDTVSVQYRRRFLAAGDLLSFSYPNQNVRFQIGGFSGAQPTIYEVTRSVAGSLEANPVRITQAGVSGAPSTYTFDVPFDSSGGAPATRSFVVAGPTGVRLPDSIVKAADPVLTDPSNAADIIVIGSPTSMDASPGGALDNLLAHRFSSQGLTSKIVYIQQIYDEFSYGLRDVNAIRGFLAYAYDNWRGASGTARPPSFVLVVGDATPDYKNTLCATVQNCQTPWVDQVPTQIMFLKNSFLGYYSSDNWIASFRGTDQIPDIYLGRVSTRTPALAAGVFDKIRSYEQSPPPGSWKGRALLLAGDGKPENPQEPGEFESVQDNLAAAYFSSAPYSVPSPPLYFARSPWNSDAAVFKTELINQLGAGAAVLSFVGHGSFETWGINTFFSTTDAASLTNGLAIPLMLNINCLTGAFHYLNPVGSLGEGMTNNPNGGAIVTIAPSGLSDAFVGDLVTSTLFAGLFGIDRNRLISSGATAMRVGLWGQQKISDAQSYTFLGDPASLISTPSPPPPTGLAAAAGNAQVTLSWTAPTVPVAAYRIYRATVAAGPYAAVSCDVLSQTSCVDHGVSNATKYYYYAVSVDPQGFWGAASNDNGDCDGGPSCVLAQPLNPGAPSIPLGLSASDPGTGGRLSISWQKNAESDIRNYTLYYGTQPGLSQPSLYPSKMTFGAAVNSALLSGLVDGTRYYLALSATNTSMHESPLSPEISAVPHLIQGIAPPRAIGDLRLTPSGSNVILSWTQPTMNIYGLPTTVASYKIYLGPSPSYVPGAATLIGTNLGGTNTTFTHANGMLATGNRYYLVTAIDTNGLVSGAGRELPNGIGSLQVSLVTANPLVVRLTWPAVTTDMQGYLTLIDHYQVHRTGAPLGRGSLNTSTILRDNLGVTTVDLDLTGLTGPSFFSVLAVDDKGNLSPF